MRSSARLAFRTAEAYRYFFEKKNTLPGAMVLTRPGVPVLAETAAKAKDGVRKGAYVLVDTEGTPGRHPRGFRFRSPVGRRRRGPWPVRGVKARVVSVPVHRNGSRTGRQYKEAVLPASVKARVSRRGRRGDAVWYKYLGSYNKPVSIEQFGLGDGAQNMIDLGITEHVVEAAKASIAEAEAAK